MNVEFEDLRQKILIDAFTGMFSKKTDGNPHELIEVLKAINNTNVSYLYEGEKPLEIPDDWKWVKLEFIGDVVGGGTPSTSVPSFWDNDGIPWCRPSDLSNYKNKYITTTSKHISEEGLAGSSARMLKAGSVLFTSRAPIGYVVIAETEMTTNQGFKSVQPYEGVSSEYIYYYFKCFKNFIQSLGTGTTFKEVSGRVVKSLPFPLCSHETQRVIVDKLDKTFEIIDKIENKIPKKS